MLASSRRLNLSLTIVAMTKPANSSHSVTDASIKQEELSDLAPRFDWSPKTQGLILGSFFWTYGMLQVSLLNKNDCSEYPINWVICNLINSGGWRSIQRAVRRQTDQFGHHLLIRNHFVSNSVYCPSWSDSDDSYSSFIGVSNWIRLNELPINDRLLPC